MAAAVAFAKQASSQIGSLANGIVGITNAAGINQATSRSLQFSSQTSSIIPNLLSRSSAVSGEDVSNQVTNLATSISGTRAAMQDTLAKDVAKSNQNASTATSAIQIGGAAFGLLGTIASTIYAVGKGGKGPNTSVTGTVGQNLQTGFSAGSRSDPGTVGSQNFLEQSALNAQNELDTAAGGESIEMHTLPGTSSSVPIESSGTDDSEEASDDTPTDTAVAT